MNNNITEDYCSFEVSKLLRKKKFDVKTSEYYAADGSQQFPKYDEPAYQNSKEKHGCSMPTHALAIKWVRENYKLHLEVYPIKVSTSDKSGYRYGWGIMDLSEEIVKGYEYNEPLGYYSFEEAVEAALLYTLTHLIK